MQAAGYTQGLPGQTPAQQASSPLRHAASLDLGFCRPRLGVLAFREEKVNSPRSQMCGPSLEYFFRNTVLATRFAQPVDKQTRDPPGLFPTVLRQVRPARSFHLLPLRAPRAARRPAPASVALGKRRRVASLRQGAPGQPRGSGLSRSAHVGPRRRPAAARPRAPGAAPPAGRRGLSGGRPRPGPAPQPSAAPAPRSYLTSRRPGPSGLWRPAQAARPPPPPSSFRIPWSATP